MKLRKILVNILVPLNSVNEINEKICANDIENDILGFHVILTNKINKRFNCDLIIECENEILWSIDKKQTINKCLNIEFKTQRCRLNVDRNEVIEIFLWSEKNEFIFKTVSNNIPEAPPSIEINNIIINDPSDKDFVKIFGFKKKYHFDHYRKLLIQSLNEQRTVENDRFISEMIDKILRDSKMERAFEAECDNDLDISKFYQKVFNNLLQENCGTLDPFNEYRDKIISKLNSYIVPRKFETKIILDRNDPKTVVKRIDLNTKIELKPPVFTTSIFNQTEINKTYNIQNVFEDIFVIQEISRKRMFFEPQNSIIIFNYKDVRIIDIEQTIDKIVNNCVGESYEILLYLNYPIENFEKLVRNYDNLFRIKVISPKNKVVKAPNYSEIQKLIIMTNFVSNLGNHIFLVGVGSIFPKKYMSYITKDISGKENRNDEMYILGKCNVLNRTNGKIDYYEANTNKLFNYFVECLFPVVPKNICKKINFKSPIFGGINSFKELKNFFMKNGTINNMIIYNDVPDNFTKEALHIFEN